MLPKGWVRIVTMMETPRDESTVGAGAAFWAFR